MLNQLNKAFKWFAKAAGKATCAFAVAALPAQTIVMSPAYAQEDADTQDAPVVVHNEDAEGIEPNTLSERETPSTLAAGTGTIIDVARDPEASKRAITGLFVMLAQGAPGSSPSPLLGPTTSEQRLALRTANTSPLNND